MKEEGSYGLPREQRVALKVVLIGSAGVGKTSLISCYFKLTFDPKSIPTVAPSYSSALVKRKDGSTIVVQIWDTAGQERYHSVSQLFFRDSDVALICFECGDAKSTCDVEEWVTKVRGESPGCQIVLVLTKADLKNEEETQRALADARERFAHLDPRDVRVTSSVTRLGVGEVFEAVAELSPRGKATVTPKTDMPGTQAERKCC